MLDITAISSVSGTIMSRNSEKVNRMSNSRKKPADEVVKESESKQIRSGEWRQRLEYLMWIDLTTRNQETEYIQ